MSKTSDRKAQEILDALVSEGFVTPGDAIRFLLTIRKVLRPKSKK